MTSEDSDWSGAESSDEDNESVISSNSETDSKNEYLYSINPNLSPAELHRLLHGTNEESGEDVEDEEDQEDDDLDEINMVWIEGENFTPVDCNVSESETKFIMDSISVNSTPFEVFSHFVCRHELDQICIESSRFVDQTITKARSKGGVIPFKNFTPYSTNELYRFLALRFATGLIKKASIKDYWSTKLLHSSLFFHNTMSRNRFDEIKRSLHFSNNDALDYKTNRMLKLGSLPNFIMQKSANCIVPGRNLCIDESLAKYKGRLSFKQYLPKKRARFGVKLYVLADCDTKFVINIISYQGETTQLAHGDTKTELGYGGAVVRSLIDPYLNTHRVVYIDNFFDSPALAQLLTQHNTGVVGTVRSNRKNMPKFSTQLKKGQVETFSNGELLVERWVDRREVLMLNNCISHAMNPNAKSKIRPASVLSYNSCMRAVDELDKSLQPYFAQRKCLKWYQKIWLRYVYIAAYNSLKMYNSFRNGKDKIPFKDFIENLIQEIIDTNRVDKESRVRVSALPSAASRLNGYRHFPKKIRKLNPVTQKMKPNFLRCVLCSAHGQRHETSYECTECKVRLCVGIADRPCFEKYHSTRNIPTKKRRLGA